MVHGDRSFRGFIKKVLVSSRTMTRLALADDDEEGPGFRENAQLAPPSPVRSAGDLWLTNLRNVPCSFPLMKSSYSTMVVAAFKLLQHRDSTPW